MKRQAIAGAISAVASAVPLALLCGLIYRFPVPFSGYTSGVEAFEGVLVAALFYGVLMGGLPFLALVGAGAATATGWWRRRQGESAVAPGKDLVRGLLVGLAVSATAVVLLANLDALIGPW